MIGAIIGDIAGSRFEHSSAPKGNFDIFTNDLDCVYTDDTVCTVAIADAIMNHKSYKESLLMWCRKYNKMVTYGGKFQDWLESDDPQPYGGYGNGAAMRVSSVGWLFNDYDTVINEARKTAEPSHNSQEGIDGAQCVAVLIYWLRTCRITKEEVESAVKKNWDYDIPPLEDIYRISKTGHFDSTCQETVPWAIRCFLESSSFEDAIRIAVMAGGDTDTKAAITGSIAEAYYDVPDDMIKKACGYLPDDILDVVERFYGTIQKEVKD